MALPTCWAVVLFDMKWLVQITFRVPWEPMTEIYSEAQEMMYEFPDSLVEELGAWLALDTKITRVDTKHRRGYSR